MEKYSYREFANITHTTLRTLRYYESINLIIPVIENGRKYIEEDYFIQLQTIQLLKKAGYTLEEIKYIIKDKNIEEQIVMQKDLLNIQLTNTKIMLSLIDEIQNENNMNISKIYTKFLQIQNRQNLQLQFETPDGLKTRVLFHHKHTHFDQNFHEWMFDHYQFNDSDKILEIGCGDGALWQCNKDRIPKNIEIILSDISQKMIDESYLKLYDIPQIKSFDLADCFCLPYDDESFEIVIINHVLMYFENLCIRDLRIYAESINGNLYHFRDSSQLECDAVIHLRDGSYGLIEIKLGGDKLIEEGVKNLIHVASSLDTSKMKIPSFLMVVTATGDYAYQRPDGVYVVPIGCLKN